jgi:hypothetical protein
MWQSTINHDTDTFFSFALQRNIDHLFWVFLTTYSRICELQRNKHDISFEDILDVVQSLPSEAFSEQELIEYSGVVYETILKPKYATHKGPFLCMRSEILQNVDLYFLEILKVAEEKKADSNQSLEQIEVFLNAFKREVKSHLEFSKLAQFQETHLSANPSETVSSIGSQRFSSSQNSSLPRGFNTSSSRDEQISEVERNDGVVRLLAYIRKGGMDIIFPQLLHDKVSEKKYYFNAVL